MRIVFTLCVCALALPGLAGSLTADCSPDPADRVIAPASKAAPATDAPQESVEPIAGTEVAKEHDNQVDDPDFPPCGDGG